jgi:hypothetical protein
MPLANVQEIYEYGISGKNLGVFYIFIHTPSEMNRTKWILSNSFVYLV